jgi:hypothetical protein
MEMVERKVEFDSARQIESTLLKHTGRELTLTEEPDEQGTKAAKSWNLGEEDLAPNSDESPSIFEKLSGHRPRFPPVVRLLRKWQRKPKQKYRPRPQPEEE